MKNKSESYDDIYSRGQTAFEFPYKNKRIGQSRPLSPAAYKLIPKNKFNAGHLTVKCCACGEYMDFFEDFCFCPNCMLRVHNETAYNQLDRENIRGERYFNSVKKPSVCKTCGGSAWPNCEISCKLFDE